MSYKLHGLWYYTVLVLRTPKVLKPSQRISGQTHLDRKHSSIQVSELLESSFGEVDVLASLFAASTSVHHSDEDAFVRLVAEFEELKAAGF